LQIDVAACTTRCYPHGVTMLRTASLILLAVLFVLAGLNHFLHPETYLAMMPPYLPAPDVLNYISGAAEVAGGVGVLMPRLRRAAAWGLVALLVAVFPANIHMALHGLAGTTIPAWMLWVRLPLQFVLMAWVAYACRLMPRRNAME
jgi:uncharacterized membrane protein